jgi:hypothetical protein
MAEMEGEVGIGRLPRPNACSPTSGGLLGEFTLAISFRNVVDRFVWAFEGVYGPNSGIDRRLLWDELAGILSWWNILWCIGGDFNVTRFPNERFVDGSMSAMRDFFDFIC